MPENNTYKFSFLVLCMLLILGFLANLTLGSVEIPLQDVTNALLGKSTSNETWQYIIQDFRLPKAITAVLVGSGLGISGLLMQTLFRNPLAGPFVLGISSGASLGVARVILGAGFFGATIT